MLAALGHSGLLLFAVLDLWNLQASAYPVPSPNSDLPQTEISTLGPVLPLLSGFIGAGLVG